MIKLKIKLAFFNLLSKLAFTAIFLIFLPYIIERINLRQVDNDLIQKREQVIDLIAGVGIDPFISEDSSDVFGSFNILKEEFISLERIETDENINHIEVAERMIEDEEITYRVLNYSFLVDGQKYLLEVGKSLASIHYARQNITRVILIFLVLIILITLLTDLQYTHLLLRPLDKISRKLKGISRPELFDRTEVRTTTTDFHNLDNALRELMENIDQLFRKEKEITVNISHELLTPVSVLRSKLENLLLSGNADAEMPEKIEESLKTLHRLQSLVNSLLMIARIESHQYLREDNFPVQDVLIEIIEEIRPIAEDKEILITEEYLHDFQFRQANRALIFSMLYNVVNNAVKNTPAGGAITIRSYFHQQKFNVTISDNGRGMTREQMVNLFSRFKSRVNPAQDGTGIGLAISKTIADFHGISVSVTSEPEKGTTFFFIFPENS
jgi:signal transduction histidine kinase